MVLVTGASGSVGSAVLEQTHKLKAPLRALYRSPQEAGKAPAGVSTVVADFADRGSLERALSGVDTVFLVCSPIPELVQLESNVIDASLDSGVNHIVLNSALGAEDYPKSFPGWHRKVEDKLKASGLGYTVLRPNGFMQNILAFNAPSIRQQGAFYSSMGSARTSYLDVRDIAAATAKILTAPDEHAGKTFELNGPEAVSYGELAERIARVANRPVIFVEIPEEAQRKSMLDMGMPEWQVDALLDLQRFYLTGKGAQITDVLERLLGRTPMKLDRFLEEFKDQFRPQSAAV